MAGWHHRWNRHELGHTLGDGVRQGGQACCHPWGSRRVGHDWETEQQHCWRWGKMNTFLHFWTVSLHCKWWPDCVNFWWLVISTKDRQGSGWRKRCLLVPWLRVEQANLLLLVECWSVALIHSRCVKLLAWKELKSLSYFLSKSSFFFKDLTIGIIQILLSQGDTYCLTSQNLI